MGTAKATPNSTKIVSVPLSLKSRMMIKTTDYYIYSHPVSSIIATTNVAPN